MNIEKEVQRLMDIEAIKDLKNRYARMCNDNHNYELVDTIFSPDVRWEGSPRRSRLARSMRRGWSSLWSTRSTR